MSIFLVTPHLDVHIFTVYSDADQYCFLALGSQLILVMTLGAQLM
uniref:Uncharacterized protein n=1 Tax=Anguilla anguilla TaxID=7936 RepID=A0A0E9QPG6_ANGAN